jgi:hypothetical protein
MKPEDLRRAIRLLIDAELKHNELSRCGDNSCMFGSPGGMATNGGCRCFDKMHGWPMEARQAVRRMATVIRSLGNLADPALLAQILKDAALKETDR